MRKENSGEEGVREVCNWVRGGEKGENGQNGEEIEKSEKGEAEEMRKAFVSATIIPLDL